MCSSFGMNEGWTEHQQSTIVRNKLNSGEGWWIFYVRDTCGAGTGCMFWGKSVVRVVDLTVKTFQNNLFKPNTRTEVFFSSSVHTYFPGRGPADGRVIRTPPPTIQAVQTRRINCDHSWKSEISDKKLVPIYIVYF
jgi:hypothetical protein